MSTTARYPLKTAPNQDNSGQIETLEYQALAYVTPIALKLSAAKTIVKIAALTGALTLTAETTRPQIGDELTIMFLSDATGRVITYSTGFATVGTQTLIASKRGSSSWIFDGTSWIETGRAIQA